MSMLLIGIGLVVLSWIMCRTKIKPMYIMGVSFTAWACILYAFGQFIGAW